MPGLHITVYKQKDGGATPASFGEPTGAKLAVWKARLEVLRWIDDLVKEGKIIALGGNGYPFEYTTQIHLVKDTLPQGPPHERKNWNHEEGDILGEGWLGKTTIDMEAIAQCPPEEWVLIRVWDES
ncbi:hypothetical protein DES53_102946 [Roseimicrobium gellanilyticum]|uniref:Uncharacterized protein n=1 Tax=Roseimicrobium gellanilyticum TaxID=748857 RepID=A0A366HS96_9BACT|nr:hypothetical protein [Roseimicrobium gellanilyticum]RBP46555.1 hypothetical protein DES53_102946 [Roseimicrobium gellanilyticum]